MLTCLGSNQDSSDPESDVLPITPRGIQVFNTTYTVQQAGDGARTRDPQLGKLMLYQLSYSRAQSHWSELNRRPLDYESSALPLSYSGNLMELRGVEPLTSAVRLQRSPS